MLARGRFLELLFSALSTTPGSPLVTASAITAGATNPWKICSSDTMLPFNHPLELTLEVLDGPDFDLAKYRGYVVLLNMFATWCPPCRDEIPAILDASHRYADRGLRVIGVDSAERDPVVRAFRKQYAIDYPIAMDREGEFIAPMETMNPHQLAIPASYFFTPYGYLTCYHLGGLEAGELNACIEALLPASPPASTPEGSPSPLPASSASPNPIASPT